MSGHSKWAQIKRQKGVNDAKRGQMFTKLAREITVAARQGGGDPETNFRLRLATQRARSMNMPQENITRAVARATGGADGAAQLEEVTYEGYGPGGVAIFVEALTDNRNRTVAEVRNVLTRNGGSLGENGSVAWIFEPRGIVVVNLDTNDADEVTLQAIDAGATDVNLADKMLEIYTNLENLEDVRAHHGGRGAGGGDRRAHLRAQDHGHPGRPEVDPGGAPDRAPGRPGRRAERERQPRPLRGAGRPACLLNRLVWDSPGRPRSAPPDQSRLDELTARARRVIAGGAPAGADTAGAPAARRPGHA